MSPVTGEILDRRDVPGMARAVETQHRRDTVFAVIVPAARTGEDGRMTATSTSKPNVVWILGAGFSMPLGGPSLRQLLSPGSFENIRERYGKGHPLASTPATFACHVYHYGRAYEDGCLFEQKLAGERLWADAEEFIDLLDSAANTTGARRMIDRIVVKLNTTYRGQYADDTTRPDVKNMREAARRLVAAECSVFANDAVLGTDYDASIVPERWSAHVEWLKQLDNRHTIVTFNYDRVIERIRKHLRKQPQPNDGPAVVMPGQSAHDTNFAGRARLLKLHGSVDWQRTTDEGVKFGGEEFALTGPESQLVIATPGPTKSEVIEALEPLWTMAGDAIENADAIVFVGYRFPPTDAVARRRLLGAIERLARKDGPIALHVVLGPKSPDAPRMEELLKFTAERGGKRPLPMRHEREGISGDMCLMAVHQLYSQDFFTVYREDLLTG